MDDDIDMTGGGELEAGRKSPISNHQPQDQEPLLGRSVRHDSHQDSPSIEYSTLADSSDAEYITGGTWVHNSNQNEVSPQHETSSPIA